MWTIFTKEGIEIFRYIPRIDFFRIPDHVVPSEFMEMKVTLKEGCARAVPGIVARANSVAEIESHDISQSKLMFCLAVL